MGYRPRRTRPPLVPHGPPEATIDVLLRGRRNQTRMLRDVKLSTSFGHFLDSVRRVTLASSAWSIQLTSGTQVLEAEASTPLEDLHPFRARGRIELAYTFTLPEASLKLPQRPWEYDEAAYNRRRRSVEWARQTAEARESHLEELQSALPRSPGRFMPDESWAVSAPSSQSLNPSFFQEVPMEEVASSPSRHVVLRSLRGETRQMSNVKIYQTFASFYKSVREVTGACGGGYDVELVHGTQILQPELCTPLAQLDVFKSLPMVELSYIFRDPHFSGDGLSIGFDNFAEYNRRRRTVEWAVRAAEAREIRLRQLSATWGERSLGRPKKPGEVADASWSIPLPVPF